MGNFLGYYRNKQLLHKDKMGYSEYVQPKFLHTFLCNFIMLSAFVFVKFRYQPSNEPCCENIFLKKHS